MRKARLIQLGIVTGLAALGMGMGAMTACTSDDNATDGGPTNPRTDSGQPDTFVPPVDSGPGVDSNVPDTGKPENAKLVFVHASPALYPVRICFAVASTIYPIVPQPDTALGIPPGAGGVFPDFGFDLSQLGTITAYFINSASLTGPDAGTEQKCDALLGGDGGLTAGVDYITLAVDGSQLMTDNTYLLSLVGCPPEATDAGLSTGLCGADYAAATGNLKIGVTQLDTTFDAGTGFGLQFAQRSSAIEGLPATADTTNLGVPGVNVVHGRASAGVVPGIIYTADGGPDGSSGPMFAPLDSTPAPVTFNPDGGINPATATSNPAFDPADPAAAFAIVTLPGSEDGGAPSYSPWPGGDVFGLSLPIIQEFSTGTLPPPSMFVPGETYTFVLVGNPQQTLGAGFVNDAGSPDFPPASNPLLGLHFLAFPNHPAVTTVTP